jgi:hypothetical protein
LVLGFGIGVYVLWRIHEVLFLLFAILAGDGICTAAYFVIPNVLKQAGSFLPKAPRAAYCDACRPGAAQSARTAAGTAPDAR